MQVINKAIEMNLLTEIYFMFMMVPYYIIQNNFKVNIVKRPLYLFCCDTTYTIRACN